MSKTSTASKNKYNAKSYEKLYVFVKRGQKEIIKARAESVGLSVNGYVNEIIRKDLEFNGKI